ncbi:MAG: hypothetical protein KDB80_14865 [Planctomycetes bacterium]|nr:hypothetical protein [Planctomycetota bacterium]
MRKTLRISTLITAAALALGPTVSDRPQDPERSEIAEVFPRTQGLVMWLTEHDPETLAKLEQHARDIAEDSDRSTTEFIAEHHPELAQVLERLQRAKHRSYRRALRDVVDDVTRLRFAKRHAPEAFPLALDAWKCKSRVRLLSARMAASDDEPTQEANDQLRDLVRRSISAERRQLEFRLKRLRGNAQRLEARLQRDLEDAVEAECKSIQDRIMRQRNR